MAWQGGGGPLGGWQAPLPSDPAWVGTTSHDLSAVGGEIALVSMRTASRQRSRLHGPNVFAMRCCSKDACRTMRGVKPERRRGGRCATSLLPSGTGGSKPSGGRDERSGLRSGGRRRKRPCRHVPFLLWRVPLRSAGQTAACVHLWRQSRTPVWKMCHILVPAVVRRAGELWRSISRTKGVPTAIAGERPASIDDGPLWQRPGGWEAATRQRSEI